MALSAHFMRCCGTRLCLQQKYTLSFVCLRGFATKKPTSVDIPKRPQTQFLKYLASIREELMKKYPEQTEITQLLQDQSDLGQSIFKKKGNTEKSVIAAQMYRNLSDQEKQQLNKDYAERLEQYRKEKESWWNGLTKEEQASVEGLKLKRKETKAMKEMNKPKKPASGFVLYYAQKWNTLSYGERSSSKLTEVAKKCSQEWTNLSEEDRKKYDNEEEIAKYREKLLEWEKAMVSKGVPSLVRRDVLKELCPPKKKSVKTEKKTTKPGKEMTKKITTKSGKDKES